MAKNQTHFRSVFRKTTITSGHVKIQSSSLRFMNLLISTYLRPFTLLLVVKYFDSIFKHCADHFVQKDSQNWSLNIKKIKTSSCLARPWISWTNKIYELVIEHVLVKYSNVTCPSPFQNSTEYFLYWPSLQIIWCLFFF